MDGDVRVLDEVAAGLLAAAKAPSAHTLASYSRRWRMWEAFALHHGVTPLPADPEHVAAFTIARWRAGVSDAALAANLSAILWFHTQLADELGGTCDLAKRVLGMLRRDSELPALSPAPVLSVGALERMVRVTPAYGAHAFSAKVLRLFSGARPRQLGALTVGDISFGPRDSWAEFVTPPIDTAGTHLAIPSQRFRFERGLTALDCPVEALRTLVGASGDGRLFPDGFPLRATIKGFVPALSEEGVHVRITVRNRALVKVGYVGALRVQELVRANVEHLEPAGDGYRLRIVEAKTGVGGASQFVLLRRDDSPLDAVNAIDEWLAVRGDHDGPLFCSLHHGRGGGNVGEALTDGEVRATISDLATAVGLPKTVSGYSLRRSWATHAYLWDPSRLALIARHLRHSSVDMTTRYIDDLGLHLLDASDYLSADVVLASPGGIAERRRDLGFVHTPIDSLVAEARTMGEAPKPRAASTVATHDSGWNIWHRWADEHELSALPATPESLVFFAAHRAHIGIAASTLRSQLRVIRQRHEEAGFDTSDLSTLADEIAQGLARSSPRERNKAPVLTFTETLALAEEAKDRALRTSDLEALQDLLLVSVTYGGALRMDDVHRARIELLDDLPYGLALRFTTSKENQAGTHPEAVLLLGRSDALDPVSAVAAWREATRIASGPLLPVLHGDRSVPLSKDTMPNRLRRVAAAAGIDTRPTGHSLRRSWATHAYDAGVDPVTISRHLRHRDLTTTLGYVQALSPWRDNAAAVLMASDAERGKR